MQSWPRTCNERLLPFRPWVRPFVMRHGSRCWRQRSRVTSTTVGNIVHVLMLMLSKVTMPKPRASYHSYKRPTPER